MLKATGSADLEEIRRQQEEAERLAREAAERAAAEARKSQEEAQAAQEEAKRIAEDSVQKGAQAAKEAAQTAQEAAKPFDIESLKGYAPEEQWDDESLKAFDEEAEFTMAQQDALENTKVRYTEKKIGELPEQLEPLREEIEASNRRGELKHVGGGAKPWIENRFNVNYGSIRDNNQAGYFATSLSTDKDKLQFFKEYASYTGQDYYKVLSEAEAKLGKRLFSTPQTSTAKIKTYNQGLANQNLMDVDGNMLDLNTATQAQIEQAIRLIPDQDAHKNAVAYYKNLSEVRGWTIDESSLGFLDSADMTQKDYNAAVSEYNERFTIGYTEANRDAYLEELDYIQSQGYIPRVQKQMELALKKSYEARTGKIAPTADEVRAALEQDAADSADGTNAQAEGGLMGFLRQMGGAIRNQVMNDLFKSKGDAEQPEPDPILTEEPEQAKTPGQAGGGSSIASGGTITAGGMELPISEPIASSGGMPPMNELFENVDVDAISSPTMRALVEEQQGKTEPQEAAAQKRYTRDIAYDPNMTDEQALSYYLGGGTLDPRNEEQIKWFTGDSAVRGVMTGLNPKDVRWNTGSVRYDTTQYWQYGSKLGAAIGVANSGILTDDMAPSAMLALGKVVKTIRDDVANPANGISIPAGQNMFDYVLGLPEYSGLANTVQSVSDAQKEIARISAENEIEAKNAHLADVQSWTEQVMAGNATPETLSMLASEYENGDYVDFSNEPTYARLKFQLGPRSDFFDDYGTFWTGDSAAAIEGRNIRTLSSAQQTYGEYKSALKREAENILESYTVAAKSIGLTLEEYLSSAGIGTIDQIIDIAYNSMQAAGNAYGRDAEAQAAVQEANANPESIGMSAAAWTGGRRAIEDRTARLMQASYLILDNADYYHDTVKDLTNSYFAKYGEEAPQMYYSDLMAVIESGQLSQATADELLANIQSTPNIFEIGYEIDGGLLESLLRDPAEVVAKDVETLDSVIAKMPENERLTANLVGSAADMLFGMATATAIGAVTGSPFAGSAVAWGLPAVDQKYDDLAGTGMTKNTRFYMAMAYGGATALANKAGTGGAMDIWGDLAKNTQRSAYMSKGMPGLIKASLKIAHAQGVQEGIEEVGEVGIDFAFDAVQDAVLAYDRGENPKLSQMLRMTLNNVYETDVAAIGKEVLSSFGMGYAMGGLFALAGAAKSGHAARKGVKMERKYSSISLARQIVDGEVELTEETLGEVYARVQKDLETPGFSRWIDSANATAREQNNMVAAAMMGAGSESRKAAVKEANRAADYREKEKAAKSAAEAATNRWVELRQQVMDGDLSLVPSMTTAQQQMGKAHTALREASIAAEKSETAAMERTREWLAACGTFKSQAMGYFANRAVAQRDALARQLAEKYEAEEARQEVSLQEGKAYAEDYVFSVDEADEAAAEEAEALDAMSDEELDREIEALNAQIADAETHIADVTSRSEELGLSGETVQELVNQELTPLSSRKDRIIAREKNRFNNLFERQQQLLEMDNDESAEQLQEEYMGVYNRLQGLGVDADALMMQQYGIEPEAANAAQEAEQTPAEPSEEDKATDSISRKMEATQASLDAINPVRRYFAKTPIYVNESQASDILSGEGLKSISQVNRRYGTKLTTDKSKGAMPLDGHPFEDISAEAPGVIDAEAEPVGEMLRILHAGKELTERQKAEKEEAKAIREKKKASDMQRRQNVDTLVIHRIDMDAIPIEENVQKVADMQPVSVLTGNEFPMSSGTVASDVREYFKSIGSSAKNPVLGDVQLGSRGVKDSIGHGLGPEKSIAFAAVPDVISKGEIINAERNWKGRGWDTFVIAAPVRIDEGEAAGNYICGVIVKRASGTQGYYLHEVILENEHKNKEGASAPFSTGSLIKSGEESVGTKSPSMNMILERVLDVKRKKNPVPNNIDAMATSGTPSPAQTAAQQKTRSKKAEVSALRAIQTLADRMGVGLRVKSGQRFQSKGTRFSEGVRGYYTNGRRNAIVRALDAGKVSVTGHEIGHAVQEQLGMVSSDKMIESWKNSFGNVEGYTPEQYDHEAFAEFFWRYLVDRSMAEAYAGDTYVSSFERALKQKKLNKAVAAAQRHVSAYMSSEADAKIRARMVDAYKANKQNDSFNTKVVKIIDDTAAAEPLQDVIRSRTGEKHLSIEDNLRDTIRFNRRAGARSAEIMTTALVDQNGDVVGESMKEALSDIKGKDFDLFWEWQLAKHSISRDTAKGAKDQVFDEESISTAEREAFIKKTEQEHPEFIQANKRFQKWRRLFMDTYLVNNGFLGENGGQLMDMLDAMYPNYVPTYRAKQKGDKRATIGGRNYTMRTATGSTEDIINPFDSFVTMINSIVQMTADNDSKLKFADLYDRFGAPLPGETGSGFGWFSNELTQDMQRVSVSTESMREKITKMLNDIGTDPDVILQIGDIIGDEKVEYHGTGRVDMDNVITVRNEDGSKRYFEIYDPDLFALLSGTNTTNQKGVLDGLANVTRMMSMLTTGSNPIFGITNAMRDFQNSVNYGSWAASYMDGAVKWLGALWDVARNGKASKEYDALGGGGWTAYDTKTRKGAEEIRGEVFKGYNRSNIGRIGKNVGRKIWKAATFEKVNEVIEKTSRLAEYKYGKHDLSTTEGRIEAFLAAQDVTTDFSRRGNGQIARDLKNLIPFFNASLQGVYRNARQFTAQESDRAAKRFAKNVINAALASALANGILLKYLDDDEKEEFAYLSDDLKAKHMFLPNFAPDVFGNAALIRIPIDQNPISYAVNAAVANFIWKGETDNEFIVELGAVADVIMDNLNPAGSTILDPMISILSNKNWYGSNIVPSYLESYDETNQYTEETPTPFIAISKALSGTGIKISPMMLQYIAEQMTGYVGQTIIPALPSEKNNNGLVSGALNALVSTARKRVTTDPLASNDVVSGVYDSFNTLQAIYKAGNSKRDFDIDYLNPTLTDRERKRAIREADDLIHSGGDIYEAKKDISAGYDKIDQINERDDLTDDEKHVLIQKVRRDMVETALDVQEMMNDYDVRYKKDSIGKRFLDRIFLN